MNTIQEENVVGYASLQTTKRVKVLKLDQALLATFIAETQNISNRDLDYIPYYRFIIANKLNNAFSKQLEPLLNKILIDSDTGALLLNCSDYNLEKENYLKIATAISHLLGLPNIDLLSGQYYATFTIEGNPEAEINLLQPYRDFKLHTDGAFMREPTNWVLMMKTYEECAQGGETILLHMDDWEDFDYFHNHPLGNNAFLFKGPSPSDARSIKWGNHRPADTLEASILSLFNERRCIRFVDQFIHPRTIEEGMYIAAIQESLNNSKNVLHLNVPEGCLLVINNHSWVHGRNKFIENPKLKRELMRQRGAFINETK